MFAPHTTHFPRTYAQAPTTQSRRRLLVHDENASTNTTYKSRTVGKPPMGSDAYPSGSLLPTKTPSRAGPSQLGKGNPNTGIRLGLGARTEGKDRNVQAGGEGVGKGKGKDMGDDIGPKRLFTSKLPPSSSFSALPKIHAQPTKTPARPPPTSRKPNLRTPAPSTFKIARDTVPSPPALSNAPAPISHAVTPLASAQRTHRRRSSRSTLGRSSLSSQQLNKDAERGEERHTPGGVVFKTPAPVKRWHEEPSLDSIDEGDLQDIVNEEAGGDVGLEVLDEEDEQGDEVDEIEYMPPKVHVPFDPGFDYPSLDIATLYAPGSPVGEQRDLPWTPELDLLDMPEISLIPDDMLEDPIFRFMSCNEIDTSPVAANTLIKSNDGIGAKSNARSGATHSVRFASGPRKQNGPSATANTKFGTTPRTTGVPSTVSRNLSVPITKHATSRLGAPFRGNTGNTTVRKPGLPSAALAPGRAKPAAAARSIPTVQAGIVKPSFAARTTQSSTRPPTFAPPSARLGMSSAHAAPATSRPSAGAAKSSVQSIAVPSRLADQKFGTPRQQPEPEQGGTMQREDNLHETILALGLELELEGIGGVEDEVFDLDSDFSLNFDTAGVEMGQGEDGTGDGAVHGGAARDDEVKDTVRG